MEPGLFREGLGRAGIDTLPMRSRASACFAASGKGGKGFQAAHVCAGVCVCACMRVRTRSHAELFK